MQEKEQSELDALKAKYGVVFALTVPINEDETEHATIYLKKLDRTIYASTQKLIEKDEMLATESLLKSLWIGGDKVEKITENFDALRSASVSVAPILKAKDGSLKKN